MVGSAHKEASNTRVVAGGKNTRPHSSITSTGRKMGSQFPRRTR